MKLIVISDSHSKSNRIKEVIEMHKSNCDAVIFLGDGLKDVNYVKIQYPQIPFFAVKGNCDIFMQDTDEEKVVNFEGKKILITHGHLYGAKSGYARLAYRAAELGADAVFFGHTHIPFDDIWVIGEKRIHLFNPGSIGYEGSFGVVNISGSVLVTSHGKIL